MLHKNFNPSETVKRLEEGLMEIEKANHPATDTTGISSVPTSRLADLLSAEDGPEPCIDQSLRVIVH